MGYGGWLMVNYIFGCVWNGCMKKEVKVGSIYRVSGESGSLGWREF